MPERERWITSGPPRVVWVVLEGGTLTSSAGASPRVPLVLPVFGPVCNVAVGGGLVVGTLLGPEGADEASSAQGRPWSHIAGPPWGVRVGWGRSGWWLFVG